METRSASNQISLLIYMNAADVCLTLYVDDGLLLLSPDTIQTESKEIKTSFIGKSSLFDLSNSNLTAYIPWNILLLNEIKMK